MKLLVISILMLNMVSCSKGSMNKGSELSFFDIPSQKCVKVVLNEDITEQVIKSGSAGTVYFTPEGANMKTSDYDQFKRMTDKCK
jgi:hypothetical protein